MSKIIRTARQFQQAGASVGIFRNSPTGGNTGRLREPPVDMAKVRHKEECETEDQRCCGRRFDYSSGSSKSTEPEAFRDSLARAGLAVTNNAKARKSKMFNSEQPADS
jgi:hypothetical protein